MLTRVMAAKRWLLHCCCWSGCGVCVCACACVCVCVTVKESSLILMQTVPTHIQVAELKKKLIKNVSWPLVLTAVFPPIHSCAEMVRLLLARTHYSAGPKTKQLRRYWKVLWHSFMSDHSGNVNEVGISHGSLNTLSDFSFPPKLQF